VFSASTLATSKRCGQPAICSWPAPWCTNLTLGCAGSASIAGDLEQTRELASSDPAVKAGQLEIQAMQWLTRPGALLEKGK
jgi:hypothetical protein